MVAYTFQNPDLVTPETISFLSRFMRAVLESSMYKGNVGLNMAADGPFMRNWIDEWRAHNYSVRNGLFLWNTFIAELQINQMHGGIRCLLVAQDTSVLEGTLYITPKPKTVSLEDYQDHFRTIFGNAEAPRGTWELFPNETAATIDVEAAKAKLPRR